MNEYAGVAGASTDWRTVQILAPDVRHRVPHLKSLETKRFYKIPRIRELNSLQAS